MKGRDSVEEKEDGQEEKQKQEETEEGSREREGKVEGEIERGGSLPNSLWLISLNPGLQLFSELIKDLTLPPPLQSQLELHYLFTSRRALNETEVVIEHNIVMHITDKD